MPEGEIGNAMMAYNQLADRSAELLGISTGLPELHGKHVGRYGTAFNRSKFANIVLRLGQNTDT